MRTLGSISVDNLFYFVSELFMVNSRIVYLFTSSNSIR